MCGISGVITKEYLTPDLKAAVLQMNEAQIHRGPDGAGKYFSDNVGLANRRLSIIDREGGWQPLYNEDKSLVLVINGEIYNFIELRKRLRAAGHKFLTEADGEVILHLYKENPTNFIEHLRGMFAFALWDVKRQRLILARDRMGEKPLYLYETNGQILFASELKALLQTGFVKFELNPQAIDLFFHFQYIPEPLTAIKGVRKLDAAQMLIVDAKSWKIEERTYWKIEDAPPIEGKSELLIREKLEEISKLIVRSDVPVGVALSGGLDSSLVAAFAKQNQPDLCAFSVGYKGRPESDERRNAEDLAKYLKIDFFDVELSTNEIVDFFPELNYWRDDPIADISGFGYYAVMKLARQHNVPVMLQGQGGDELFWGYPQMQTSVSETLQKAALRQNPFSQKLIQSLNLQKPAGRSVTAVSNWIKNLGGVRSAWRNVRQNLQTPDEFVFFEKLSDFVLASEQMPKLYNREFVEQIEPDNATSLFDFADKWNDVETTLTGLACATYLRENGITQGDRLGMASSVEMRLPLVDHKFVETVIGLRKAQTDAHLPPKYWLKKSCENILPDWVLNRPKRGFAPPTQEWHKAIFASHGRTLDEGYLVESNILSPQSGRILAKGNFPNEAITPISFKALVLEQWCRQLSNI